MWWAKPFIVHNFRAVGKDKQCCSKKKRQFLMWRQGKGARVNLDALSAAWRMGDPSAVHPPPASEQHGPRTPAGLSTTDPIQASRKSLTWAKARLQLHPCPFLLSLCCRKPQTNQQGWAQTCWDQLPYRAGMLKAGESTGNGLSKASAEDVGGAMIQIAIQLNLPSWVFTHLPFRLFFCYLRLLNVLLQFCYTHCSLVSE